MLHVYIFIQKVESLRDQLRGKNTSGRRQAYASSSQGENLNGDLTRLNSTDSAFSVSTEDRIGTRVVELESEIKSLKVLAQINRVSYFIGKNIVI